jgi:methylglutaconyl-CoA hydratase
MLKEIKGGHLRTETHNGITTIEFFHPKSNSLPGKLLEELANAIHGAGNEDDTRVIILSSAGEKAFCAGAAFDELTAIKTSEQGFDFFSGFADVINAMRKCPKFIIARVHGKCVGGGVGIVAAADYAIATDSAEIRLSELAIGIGPFVVGPAVERRIGTSAFSHLAIDAGMWRSADWAKRKGLFAELHSSVVDMDEAIRRLSGALSHSNPEAMAGMKKIFWKDCDHWDQLLPERAAVSGKLVLSQFTRDALAKIKV